MKHKQSESKKEETKIDDNCIFSKEEVNLGHQPEFDYLKTLGVICMALIHVYIHSNEGYLFYYVDHIVNVLTAGALQMLMGIGMKYSPNHDAKRYFSRGILFLTMGQYLNLIRNCIPYLIAWKVTGNKKFISRALSILQTDILSLAGFACIFMSILKKMKISDKGILIIGTIMNFVAWPLFKIMKQPDSYLLKQLLGYFVLTNAESHFPLCSYFIFLAFGNWVADYYKRMKNKDKFYNRILIFCFPIAVIYQYLRTHYNIPILTEYGSYEHYNLNPFPDAIYRIMANIVILAMYYKLDKILGKTPYIIRHCAKNLNQYYLIGFTMTMHFIVYLRVTRGDKYPSQFQYTDLFSIFLLFSSYYIIELNDKYIHFAIFTLKNPIRIIIYAVIWIMTVVSVIYIYPKVDEYTNVWNNYLYEV